MGFEAVRARVVAPGLVVGMLIAMGCAGDAREAPTPAAGEVAVASEGPSLDDLGGVEWILTRLSADERVPKKPEITLMVAGGRFAGTSGCNRYSAFGQAGENPGELSLGPSMGTKMACTEEVMALESSFLSKLQGASGYRVADGVLSLDWSTEQGDGTMTFSSRPLQE